MADTAVVTVRVMVAVMTAVSTVAFVDTYPATKVVVSTDD